MKNPSDSPHFDPSFENRKADHITLSLRDKNEAIGGTGLEDIELIHEALPDLNLSEVSIMQKSLGKLHKTPFLVSSMTAGHEGAQSVNQTLAAAAAKNGWMMGVGSQRRQLFDEAARQEWVQLKKKNPELVLLGNIGLSQLSSLSVDDVQLLADTLGATAMIVHTNPLQEAIQPEGTPNFKGALAALEILVKKLNAPVIVKETGCGMSLKTLKRLESVGVAVVDVGGFGGTHWGRIEGDRAEASHDAIKAKTAETFSNWGISTVDSVLAAVASSRPYEIWASGGVRTGLDSAKLLAMGAQVIGFAKPALKAALIGEEALTNWMNQIEYELRVALFCTGTKDLNELLETKRWINKKK